MTRLLKAIRDAVPGSPLLIGEVVGAQGDELRIQTPDAGLYPAQPDVGPLLCVCHDVGENAVRAAICAGASSVAAVGAATCAGTNCGSCRPQIARLLEETLDPLPYGTSLVTPFE